MSFDHTYPAQGAMPPSPTAHKYATYVIAAHDSDPLAKAEADVVCDGLHDAECINALLSGAESVKLYFKNGTYNVNSFTFDPISDRYVGILVGNLHAKRNVILEGESKSWIASYPNYDITGGVIFRVDLSGLAEVDPKTPISAIFANATDNSDIRAYPQKSLELRNLSVLFADNQRPNVYGIDLSYCSGMDVQNVFVKVDLPKSDLMLPAENTTAIYGMMGSKFSNYNLTNCWVMGFDKGYRLSGENIVATNAYAYYCNYPFYLYEDFSFHSNVFIKCGEERCKRSVYFARGMQKGTLTNFISYDMEVDPLDPVWSKIEGAAIENPSGHGGGQISFCATRSNVGSIPYKFFRDGDGENFTVTDSYNKRIGTSEERPTLMHIHTQYFDTTLGKTIVYNGENWVDFMGNVV